MTICTGEALWCLIGIPILGSRIPGSLDPGPFSQSRILGLAMLQSRDFGITKNEQNAPHDICPKILLFPNFWGIPGCKDETERTRPQNQLLDHGRHRYTARSLFIRLHIRYSISLDAQACDAVKERKFCNRPIFLLSNNGF